MHKVSQKPNKIVLDLLNNDIFIKRRSKQLHPDRYPQYSLILLL